MRSYYFDYNSTTPVLSQVAEAMKPFLTEHYANPSSLHHMGREPYRAIRQARRQIMSLLGAKDESEIIFTSGGSESNTTAIRAALAMNPEKKEVVTTVVEHSSIKKLFQRLEEKEGYKVHWVGVDPSGQLDLNQLESVLSDQVAVVSVMWVNNETGVCFPIEKISQIVKAKKILFHVDAVQAVGKCLIDVEKSPIDFLSIAGHKFYSPKGIGALYSRQGLKWDSLIVGGFQENSHRAGTENVPGIVAFGLAGQIAQRDLDAEKKRLGELRDFFEDQITTKIPDIVVHGQDTERVMNTSNVRFLGIKAETLLMALDHKNICVSRGSACMSGAEEASYVLQAMGLSDEEANASMRFSFGRQTEKDEVEYLVRELSETVRQLRSFDEQDITKKEGKEEVV